MTAMPLVRLQQVTIARGGRTLATDVSLELGSADLLAVTGPNGAGKSTLVHTVLGLVPPATGEISLLGRAPSAARVAFVPQAEHVDPLFPLSVEDVLRTAAVGRAALGDLERDRTLAEVGLPAFHRRLFSSLSGGERQRALLARAFLSRSAVIIMDEPTSAVDEPSERGLYSLLAAHLVANGAAALVVCHSWEALAPFATHRLELGTTRPRCERMAQLGAAG